MPWFLECQVNEVDYSTFMTMTEDKDIGLVEISESKNQITFNDKAQKQVYKTAMVNDPDLTQRLYSSGERFSGKLSKNLTGYSASY